jgi:hypothetical protein
MRALAAALLLAGSFPTFAQVQPPAAPTSGNPVPAAAGAATAGEQRQQVTAALQKSAALVARAARAAVKCAARATERKIPGDALVATHRWRGARARWSELRRAHVDSESESSAMRPERRLRMAARADPRGEDRARKGPAWLEKNSVLGLEFGTDAVPVAPGILPVENGRIKGANHCSIRSTINSTARTKFVRPPDPVIGDLFASAGDLAIASAVSPLDDRQSKLEPAKYYESALEYGAPHADLIRKRLAKYQADFAALPPAPKEEVAEYPVTTRRFEQAPLESSSTWLYVGAATALTIVLVVVGIVIDRRRRKRAEATPAAPLPDVD